MASAKNNDIQCLRAFAILLVLVQHTRARIPTPDIHARLFEHAAFWPGVDIFFAISGFLICQTFLRDLNASSSRRDAFKEFWIRRVARLLPAVIFWVAISVAVAAYTVSYSGADPIKVAAGGAMSILGLSNLWWVECVKAGRDVCGSADFNGVTWSLSLEWQLYAILTALIFFAGKRRAIGLLIIAAVLMSFLPAPSFSYPWAFRIQAFSLGAVTYCVLSRHPGELPKLPINTMVSLILVAIGILICVIAPVKLHEPLVIPTIALGALLCLLGSLGERPFSQSRAFSPLIWIGERSYSIYLCHLPIILFVRETMQRTLGLANTPTNQAIALLSVACLVALCADLSYRYIELPFQEWAKRKLAAGSLTLSPRPSNIERSSCPR
ncbi:acyltransferase [Achromobacter sp. NFACC18-2]|uniref:acyltransferase family protein n=1 Tax=Achromobacter sp. NFACC18-2 TaxID=1564112 RepID=UPI0008B0F121|nr:acyltransferase [Achromobacter sp. NFACC18-2]SEK05109.1 Peptidoglycan/LPS O-acetylase OafA/YrhL, contains acyltransferase and SGNH-hydrolase domains [Achromobacter sp. NFACC18-2]